MRTIVVGSETKRVGAQTVRRKPLSAQGAAHALCQPAQMACANRLVNALILMSTRHERTEGKTKHRDRLKGAQA